MDWWNISLLAYLLPMLQVMGSSVGNKHDFGDDQSSENKPSYALVPYTEPQNGILSEFYATSKNIKIPNINKTFEIKQNWNENGVAGVVWEAAKVLGNYMKLHCDMRNKSVLELGAGTGLAGMVASHLGAKVTLTDINKAIPLLNDNIELNFPANCSKQLRPKSDTLEWGQDLNRYSSNTYDYIIGADIIYMESTFDALAKTLTVLASVQSMILLSAKLRYDRVETFLEKLKSTFKNIVLVTKDDCTGVVIYKCCKS